VAPDCATADAVTQDLGVRRHRHQRLLETQ
jgi:hypothetical protein